MVKLQKPVVLIDGDIMCYRAAAATDGRYYQFKYLNKDMDIITVVEKYKKDIVAQRDTLLMDEESARDVRDIELCFEPEPEAYALHLVDKMISSLETQLKDNVDQLGPIEVYLSEGNSFRNEIFPDYKMNRNELRRPANLSACKQHCLNKYGAVVRPGELEADDLITIRATELAAEGIPFIIVSIDKDLKQMPGHHFDFTKDIFLEVTEGEALRNLYMQVLMGDKADGIPGLKGVGPKTAEKIVSGLSTEWTLYVVCLKEYIKKYPGLKPEDVQVLMHLHMNLLFLLRSEDKRWEAPKMEEQ